MGQHNAGTRNDRSSKEQNGALAHRMMALSALRASSSLSVRLKRYNHHMDQARAVEAQGGAQ
ncbi:hypothetical protein [Pseudomonas sp. SWRI77]|uniref:hypothetical protein n=1 Tax=Pseudomonas sp. SWRI77 TaxID=2745485 RepID=UPI0032099584